MKPDDEQQRGTEAQQQRQPPAARLLDRARVDDHVLLVEQRLQAGIGELRPHRFEERRGLGIGVVGRVAARFSKRALDDVSAAGDLGHVARADLLLEERVRHVDALLRPLGQEHLHQQVVQHQHRDEAHPPRARPHRVGFRRVGLTGRRLHVVRARGAWATSVGRRILALAYRLLRRRGLGVPSHFTPKVARFALRPNPLMRLPAGPA